MGTEQATLAGGCFWCTEAVYSDVIGISHVESGYTGGEVTDPDYRSVCAGNTGHAEAVRLTFDSDVIAFDDLLDIFFNIHDPTQLNRQGNDVGTQYRSAIFPHSEEQKAAAEAAIERASADWDDPVVTTIEPLEQWYKAEDYHQDYFEREGSRNPYCMAVVAPKLQKFRRSYQGRLKKA
ncbi:peptide-methionine (S)-S-oxide reductase MsrA [Parasphingopyxis lamellibrachiae]|uniref:Peptide methionine sulfoxide reductase MsrA n=1 Tax=Parasphingopyxis lamellibrachiae TaxID=680125 RepID=A0A3D9FE72_9SPHN|nr:peptide-methionine (S)-S-oxide reductase MsrA [Parasphingopyxis lamellibrachiae]RED16089.1 peptide-methionine (S)-S-oxide reductase [Parasphingopyxis lamellibrachiae]